MHGKFDVPIFATDHAYQVTVWNDKIEEMTSISKAEIYGRCIGDLLSTTSASASASAPPLTDGAVSAAGAAAPLTEVGMAVPSTLTSGDVTSLASGDVTSLASGVSVEGEAAMLQMLSRALEGRQVSCFDFEVLSRNHHRLVQLQVNAEPKLDAAGNVVGVVCVGQDVFSQKEMVREHMENLKLKEINIAKDVRQPLAPPASRPA